MINNDFNEKLDRFTRGIIRRKVNQLIGRAGFTHQDQADLEHKFIARVLQSLHSFDPDQGHQNAFVTAVVERFCANILREKQAPKRDHRRIGSLNVVIHVKGERSVELAQTIGQRELDARRDCYPRSEEELAQLVRDFSDVIATLPDNLRDLAERRKTQNVSEIARETGIPRTTLNEKFRKILKRFEKAGLKDYL